MADSERRVQSMAERGAQLSQLGLARGPAYRARASGALPVLGE